MTPAPPIREAPKHPVSEVALGEAVAVGDTVAHAGERFPGVRAKTAPQADILRDQPWRGGPWGPCDIGRVVAETGWRLRPMRDTFHDDMGWTAGRETA